MNSLLEWVLIGLELLLFTLHIFMILHGHKFEDCFYIYDCCCAMNCEVKMRVKGIWIGSAISKFIFLNAKVMEALLGKA